MKKKLLSLMLVATMSFGITACGNSTESTDSKRVAELEEQIEELQQQLEEATQGQTDSSTSTGNFDSETQSLIDSINADTADCYGSCGPDAMYYYKGGILVIKGIGEIVDNTWAQKENDDYNLNITRVIIDEGITSIGEKTFINSDYFYISMDLYKVTLPSTLTNIGERAFANWEELVDINIPDSVNSIGTGAFYDCHALDSATLEKIEAINPSAYNDYYEEIETATETIYDTEQ